MEGDVVGDAEPSSGQGESSSEELYPVRCSFFGGAFDRVPRPWRGTWSRLAVGLDRTFSPQAGTEGAEAKKTLPALCAAGFRSGAFRSRDGVEELGLLILDVDNTTEVQTGEYWSDPRTGRPTARPVLRKVPIEVPVTLHELGLVLRNAGVASCSWTTWSHTPEWPKSRVVIPLAGSVPADFWPRATEWVIRETPIGQIVRGLDLPVLRDVARLHFLPGSPDPRSIRRIRTYGHPLEIPLDALQEVRVEPLPVPAWQVDLITRRNADDEGTHWASRYRVGGQPIDFQALDLAALLAGRGVKVGQARVYGAATKWRSHCPWAHEHTNGLDDDSAVVIQELGRWPIFRCSHSHHAHLGLRDVLELFWG